MFTEEQVDAFHDQGFLLGPRIYDDRQCRDLLDRMHSVMEGRAGTAPEAVRNLLGEKSDRVVIQIVNIWEADPLFREHLYEPQICALASQLMDHPVVRVWHDQVQYKPAHVGGPTNWHQDHPYWPIIQPADLVSAWVALDDADVENGCMWMVPGSHKWGPHKGGTIGTDPETFAPQPDLELLPPGISTAPVPCPVPRGHVMFHHCLTWHGSPNNNSERGRPAIAVHYMPGYTRYEPKSAHLVQHRVKVKPGETLQGEFFPTVWDGGPTPH